MLTCNRIKRIQAQGGCFILTGAYRTCREHHMCSLTAAVGRLEVIIFAEPVVTSQKQWQSACVRAWPARWSVTVRDLTPLRETVTVIRYNMKCVCACSPEADKVCFQVGGVAHSESHYQLVMHTHIYHRTHAHAHAHAHAHTHTHTQHTHTLTDHVPRTDRHKKQ